MCLEIWNMRIAVSNVVSEYSLGGVYFTHRVRDMMFDIVKPVRMDTPPGRRLVVFSVIESR